MQTDDPKHEYQRPKDNAEALQIAIHRWITFQYRVWDQESKQASDQLGLWAAVMRVTVIVLAGSVTVMTSIEGVDRTLIALVSGTLAILTGIESYLKLADRRTTSENRRAAVLAEYDRQGYEWMTKVELETDTDKALEQAKLLLASCPNAVNDIVNKYISRQLGDEPTKAPTT